MVDTTVQEKAITCPTDIKLAIKIINRLNKLPKAKKALKRLLTIVRILMRELDKELPDAVLEQQKSQ